MTDTPAKNALGFSVEDYTTEMGKWNREFRQALYDQAYESACSVVFKQGVPTTPGGFLIIAYAVANAAVAAMSMLGYVGVEPKGQASDAEPELPLDFQGPRVAGGYL